MKIESLNELYREELADLYDAEQQIVDALPKMIKAADSVELQEAFREHLDQTQVQVQRLEAIFNQMDEKPKSKTCKAMKGLISEGNEMVKARGEPAAIDAALIAAAQRVEHYEIAAYGTARTYAEILNCSEAADLLQQTLDEESETDRKLTQIAESVNLEAAGQEF